MATPAPFTFGRIADRANFADREAERARLIGNFGSLVNTTIISPRRWGKSSLVAIAAEDAEQASSGLKVCQIDVFGVRDEREFYTQLAKGVIRATSSRWEEWVEAVQQFLGRLRPKLSVSPDPTVGMSIDFDLDELDRSADEVLDLAEKIAIAKGIRLVVCIDEFQAVADFAEPIAFQRRLRSHWQQHHHVCYCLYGSKRHLLTEIFSNPELPFYRFGDILALGRIDNQVWGRFIAQRFTDTGKTIEASDARRLASLVDNHSYYVQQLAQLVWFRATPTASAAMVDEALDALRDQLSLLFVSLTESMTARQLNLLRAVLADEPELSSQATLKRYQLGTSANVTRMKETLVNREIIDLNDGRVELLDPVFKHWLRTDYFHR